MKTQILGIIAIIALFCALTVFSGTINPPCGIIHEKDNYHFFQESSPGFTEKRFLSPSIEWVKKIGSYDSDYARSVQQTRDGGYIIGGFTYSFGSFGDIWLIKTDSQGDVIWNNSFGGISEDYGYSVQQTEDDGYILAGYTLSFGAGNKDVWVIKTDSTGQMVWAKTYGDITTEWGRSLDMTSDGGFIIAGFKGSSQAGDAWILKIDGNGEVEWDTILGGPARDTAQSVEQTTDGGYIISGYTASKGLGDDDVWLIKLDSHGELQWEKNYGDVSSNRGYSVQQTHDEGYIIAGWTGEPHSDNILLLKTDSEGKIQFQHTYGGLSDDYGFSLTQTRDYGYIVVGYTYQNNAQNEDIIIIRADQNGKLLWNMTYGGPNSDWGWSVQQTRDGGYIIAGDTWSADPRSCNIWLIKLMAEDTPPASPSTPQGPLTGVNGARYTYTTEAIDPRNLPIKYYFDWGDGTGNWTNYGTSGQTMEAHHQWKNPGTYYIRAQAQNSEGTYSMWSSSATLILLHNTPPETPDRPTGSSSGRPNELYTYSTVSVDPDDDSLYYLFDWGDGTASDWIGPYSSGENITSAHSWGQQGTYNLRVKARDDHTVESAWSDPLTISMPKNQFPWLRTICDTLGDILQYLIEHLFTRV